MTTSAGRLVISSFMMRESKHSSFVTENLRVEMKTCTLYHMIPIFHYLAMTKQPDPIYHDGLTLFPFLDQKGLKS